LAHLLLRLSGLINPTPLPCCCNIFTTAEHAQLPPPPRALTAKRPGHRKPPNAGHQHAARRRDGGAQPMVTLSCGVTTSHLAAAACQPFKRGGTISDSVAVASASSFLLPRQLLPHASAVADLHGHTCTTYTPRLCSPLPLSALACGSKRLITIFVHGHASMNK
jgi:hypothetical protein